MAQRGAAWRSSEVPGSGSAGAAGDLTEARQAGVGQRGLWTPGRSTLQEGEPPVNAAAAAAATSTRFSLGMATNPVSAPRLRPRLWAFRTRLLRLRAL